MPDGRAAADGGQYFARSPEAPSRPRTRTVDLGDGPVEVTTDAAVFSPKRLDPGTAFLLERAPDPPAAGTFLDLGCGWGPLALALARRSPAATVHAVDVNARARHLCAENAAALGLPGVVVSAPEDVDPEVRFDLVWSNPPIRVGKAVLHDLLGTWLDRLTPEGRAVLVVGRNLGADSLHRWLDERGNRTERIGSRAGYRLLSVAAS